MDLRDVELLARRHWADRDQRNEYWAERYRREGSAPARKAAAALQSHARRINSRIFDEPHRAEDLKHHLHLCEQLSRVGRAIAGR
jgi:hypothetical protein